MNVHLQIECMFFSINILYTFFRRSKEKYQKIYLTPEQYPEHPTAQRAGYKNLKRVGHDKV